MNTQNLAKRTSDFKGTAALKLIHKWIEDGQPIRPCYTSGSGRFTSNQDHAASVRTILRALNCPFTAGNDAPRGGLTGQWIKPSAASWRKMQPVRDQWAREAAIKQEVEKEYERKTAEERAAKYADKLDDHKAVLIQWWKDKEFHPAPPQVLAAKHASGLTWKQVRTYCKAHA